VRDSALALLCRSRPIVEASCGLRLACYDLQYAGLGAQLQQQRMSPLHNFWSHVYDFTPGGRRVLSGL
jgi:protein XRP2